MTLLHTPQKTHYALYPYPLVEGYAGGLPSVFLHETHMKRDLVLFTTDKSSCILGNARIVATQIDKSVFGNLFRYWFGIGCWQWLHPDAHTDKAGDPGANRFMLGLAPETSEVSQEDLLEYVQSNGLPGRENEQFNNYYEESLMTIRPGSVVNWQDFMFVPSILKHAQRLRSLGIHQTFHLHTTVPESLTRSAFGINVLQAMSAVDTVYLHTDEYIRRAEMQLRSAGLRVPTIKRFDLGINRDALDEDVRRLEGNNLSIETPEYTSLDEERRQFVIEILRSQGTVPHRFISIDRVDPAKGTATVVKAITRFLDLRAAAGESLAELQLKYRFFFLQPFIREPFDSQNLQTGWYGEYIRKLFGYLVARYPGVVFVSDAFHGRQRLLIPALLHGAHGITGGAQDGLNLAIMETAYVNHNMDTTVICGTGAGFAIQAMASGLAEHAFFPKAGDVDAFVRAIQDIVCLQARQEWALRHRKAPLVKYIMQRNDSVIVDD